VELIPVEGAVPFGVNGLIIGGISHTPGSGEILFTESGIYDIIFSVQGDRSNQFALFLDGVLIPGTVYGIDAANISNIGRVIVSITAPAVLTVRNHTSFSPVALETQIGGQLDQVNASIQIVRLV
jgi:hypothetical protein